jgi:regulator of protease activity HflC (stomatin/prohibitin superfamily)
MRNLVLLLLLGLTSVACSKVPAGNVGVKVYLLGGSKGVDSEVLGVGRYWIGLNEELYIYPTFQQTRTYTQKDTDESPGDESFTFQTSEGMVCNMDLGVTFSINREKISALFQKYRRGVDEIQSVVIKNAMRDALVSITSKMPVESVYGEGKADMINKVEDQVRLTLKDAGILIEKVYLVGSIRLPGNVVEALNSKIEATQRAQQRENELREAEAQAKKNVAEADGKAKSMIAIAEAESKANSLKQKTLTKELIEYEAVQRWNGVMPTVTSGAIPFLNLKLK